MSLPKTYVINSEKGNNPFTEDSPDKRIIAIGGFKLSRGLTLEGLTISYYYRRSKMYDTLMQMARWYGYHDGYKDILKLWIASESSNWYQHIYESTEELKDDLEIMESQRLEPKDFGIKERSHPDT